MRQPDSRKTGDGQKDGKRRVGSCLTPGGTLDLLDGLFRGVIPDSPLAAAVQRAAKHEGWTPPEEKARQKSQRTAAGAASGRHRRGFADLRRIIVKVARMELSPEQRREPYSTASFQALRETFDNILASNSDDKNPLVGAIHSALSRAGIDRLKGVSDDTLMKDLKAIRKSHGVSRGLKTR
jgi:hypothetical protein